MKRSADVYVDGVMAILNSEFPELADPLVASIVADRVRAHVETPSRQLEVILDNPQVANWRLTAGLDDVSTVRVGNCSLLRRDPSQPHPREDRVNQRLAALAAP